jgi:rRNA maturation RNase YbeY
MSSDAQAQISFFVEGQIEASPLQDVSRVERWLTTLATRRDAEILALTFILADDDYILNINRDYLDHDFYTDIITFPYRQGEVLEADIFISIDRVKDNATQQGEPYLRELRRVIAHGVLHLLGYRDKTSEEQKAMRMAEESALTLYDELEA